MRFRGAQALERLADQRHLPVQRHLVLEQETARRCGDEVGFDADDALRSRRAHALQLT
jgi:hypothetical protein